MRTLDEEVLTWSEGRPRWQRVALRLLVTGSLDDEAALAELCLDEAIGKQLTSEPLSRDDFASISGSDPCISIHGIEDLLHVNALAPEQTLKFGKGGITLVYGENGSGKSGYARVLKAATRARHREEVLPDVFEDEIAPASATLIITAGDEERRVHWPTEAAPELARVSFYDSRCGGRYVVADNEVAYRPALLRALDQLAQLCGLIRDQLEKRKSALGGPSPDLPAVAPESALAKKFASYPASLRADLDELLTIPSDADARLRSLCERESALVGVDPARERARLQVLRGRAEAVQQHLAKVAEELGDAAVERLETALTAEADLRAAALAVGSTSFDEEPLRQVGGGAWRALWDAAKAYSEDVAYPGVAFPVTVDDAKCVLCQQLLGPTARERLSRFDQFVRDETQRRADEAADEARRLVAAVQSMDVIPTTVGVAVESLVADFPEVAEVAQEALSGVEQRRTALVAGVESGGFGALPEMPALLANQLTAVIRSCDERAADLGVDDVVDQLERVKADRVDLQTRIALAAARPAIEAEIARREDIAAIEAAVRLTDTRGITKRAAELTRTHISDELKHRFSQETLRLGLQRVMLADGGGERGQLRHQATLVGAKQRASLPAVLSEGEQTALGLAAFLTEVESDGSKSCVVFDDPVSSLDHVRKEKVAHRVVDLATERQVVIFTHDLPFVMDLKRAASKKDVDVTEWWIFKRGTQPGNCRVGHPWDAKLVGERLQHLDERLAVLRSSEEEADPEEFAREVRSWYQDLRLAWERMIEELVVGRVLNRGELEVRPLGFRVLVRITDEDNEELQTAFKRCGERGSHDRSDYLNRPVPEVGELANDLATARAWQERMKSYARS